MRDLSKVVLRSDPAAAPATGPISLADMYSGANALSSWMGGIPSSGTISINNFRGKSLPYPDDLATGTTICLLSTRLLTAAYTGFTMNLRRSSDNATKQFYSDKFGNIDDHAGVTLAQWLNGATAYVIYLYDQTGNNRHAYQSTNTLQPSLTADAQDPSKYHVNFNANAAFLTVDSLLPIATVSLNAIYVAEVSPAAGGIYGCIFHRGNSTGCQYEPRIYTDVAAVSGCSGSGNFAYYSMLTTRPNILMIQPGDGSSEVRVASLNNTAVSCTQQGRGRSPNSSNWDVILGGTISGGVQLPGLIGFCDVFAIYSPGANVSTTTFFLNDYSKPLSF